MAADTYERPKHGWTCFHCGETFTTVGSARDHFGYTQFADPGCIIDKVAVEEGGKPERGRGLLMALRKAEADLERYRQEDTDLHRALHAKDCERGQAVQRAEEQGYARGLRDGIKPHCAVFTMEMTIDDRFELRELPELGPLAPGEYRLHALPVLDGAGVRVDAPGMNHAPKCGIFHYADDLAECTCGVKEDGNV